ncbi:MAG TPA: methyltransferase domain-containing protein [Actinomycetota bacterium]|nr:methyltransferase domain-containing protein [Actinomycetota bacterium]
MDDYGASTYGDRVADVYDEMVVEMGLDTEGTVGFLASLAGEGPVLELAIGTGRIALPLHERGLQIHGIDASEAMIAKLREKPGGADLPVTIGDFAEVGVEGRYRLIYVVFNTLWALLSQEDQTRCVRNVAEHLTPGGAFVVEAFVPDPARFDRGQRIHARTVASHRVVLEASTHDPKGQRVSAQQVVFEDGGGIRMYPVEIRYLWPSELDLMARLAGLRLRQRWGGWHGEPYTGEGRHVSVYEPDDR